MTTKPRTSRRRLPRDARKPSVTETPLEVGVKVRLLHTIADTVYATPVGKIREAVANADDNEADTVLIVVDSATSSISIFDNGRGISRSRFDEIFKSIGYPLMEKEQGTLSYFGLGLISVFQLGSEVTVFTRPKGPSGKNGVLRLRVETRDIFSQDNVGKPIADLGHHLKIRRSDGQERSSLSPVPDDMVEAVFGDFPSHFTEMIMTVADGDTNRRHDLDEMCGAPFLDELRKFLPLPVADDEPFLKQFSAGKAREIREMLADPVFCPSLHVYFGV
ncbi:MAG TPA: ATP-binding protein, partial [Phycisphaerae bacterium]|nr:ATP-binding protein [Phycisphaerae bacterium]